MKATFAAGCFWCIDTIFRKTKGISTVKTGYSGGTSPNPTYSTIHHDNSGHAEAVQIEYNEKVIPFAVIVRIFFTSHDPTTLNRQGADVGEEYRSILFYHNEKQKKVAETVMKEVQKVWDSPIVTEIQPYINFYEAEKVHQDFYANNKFSPYCLFVINPKLKKCKIEFQEYLS